MRKRAHLNVRRLTKGKGVCYSKDMNIYTLTVTSKNQVTLPADVVRQLSIARNRKMELRVEGDSLRLTPRRSLQEAMKKYKDRHHAKAALASEDIQKATAAIIAEKAAR